VYGASCQGFCREGSVIIHDVAQGSPEWLQCRLGIPTSSCFDQIVTPTGKLSKSSRKYALKLVAEIITGRSTDGIGSLEWVARGKELEPYAAEAYEMTTGTDTQAVGFITTDDGQIGCSPDRLTLDGVGGVELKCPAPHTHIGYVVDGFGSDYIPQVQGQLYVAELEWVDRFSFHPEAPAYRERTYRDEAFIKTLAQALDEFNQTRLEMLETVKARGLPQRPVSQAATLQNIRLPGLRETESNGRLLASLNASLKQESTF
jgi:hypothetical protein